MLRNISSINKLQINCKTIAQNYELLKGMVGSDVICASNLKSNAYNLGAIPIMHCLSKAGCSKFFVSNLQEALELRGASLTDEIYVLNGIFSDEEDLFAQNNIIPVLNNVEQFELYNNFCKRKNKRFSAALNVDNDNNMVGLSYGDTLELAEKNYFNQKVNIKFIMSYFSNDKKNNVEYHNQQLKNMSKLRQVFAKPVSLANSAAIILGKEYYFDMVRMGLILFGITKEDIFDLKNAISLTSRIIHLSEFNEPKIIARIPIGYGDGILSSLAHKGVFYVHGYPAPVIKVLMDYTMLDVSNVPDDLLYSGVEVEIIGKNSTVNKIAMAAEVSITNVIVSLSPRIQRTYLQ